MPKTPDKTPDLILHDGREIVIDEFAITHGEYAQIMARTTNDEEDEAILAKTCGLTLEEVKALPEKDWRALTKAIFTKVTTPDPT